MNEAIMSPDRPMYEQKGADEARQFFLSHCRLHYSKRMVQSMGERRYVICLQSKDVNMHAHGEGFREMAYILAKLCD